MAEDDGRHGRAFGYDVSVPPKHPSSSDREGELFLVGSLPDPWVQFASGRILCLRARMAGVPFGPPVVQVPLSPECGQL